MWRLYNQTNPSIYLQASRGGQQTLSLCVLVFVFVTVKSICINLFLMPMRIHTWPSVFPRGLPLTVINESEWMTPFWLSTSPVQYAIKRPSALWHFNAIGLLLPLCKFTTSQALWTENSPYQRSNTQKVSHSAFGGQTTDVCVFVLVVRMLCTCLK